ncbi:MAG: hypothetical protein ABIP88_11625 [Candidatus Binatia bacterium]
MARRLSSVFLLVLAGRRHWHRRPFPTPGGIQTVLDELAKEAKTKTWKYDDFVDLRALRELEKEGFFK